MEECVAKSDPTIVSLDSELSRATSRLEQISDNLNSGVYGSSGKEGDEDKGTMENPSLASLQRRINYIFGHISDIERLANKIYTNQPIAG